MLTNVKNEVRGNGGLKINISCQNNSTISIIPVTRIQINDTIRKMNILDSSYDMLPSEPNSGCGGDIIIENKSVNQQPATGFELAYGVYEANISLEYFMLDFLTPREQLPTKNGGEAYLKIYYFPIRLIVSIIVAIIILIMFLFWKNYRHKKLLSICNPYVVQNSDTLDLVCTKFKVNPKIIVKLNKIKFPFTLIPGTKIMVPNIKK